MKNDNIFTIVSIDPRDEITPIISDGNRFFLLGDYLNGIYTCCCEVRDKYGCEKDNDSHFANFKRIDNNSFKML
jgi:hypothetical protein